MADPRPEKGYTKIPNSIIEALCRVNLSPYQSRVLWLIFRKTYGWHKEADRLPLSQICSATGIARSNVSRALKALVARNMITRRDRVTAFQLDYGKWVKAPGKEGPMEHRAETRGFAAETLTVRAPPRGQVAVSDGTTTSFSADNKLLSLERPSKENTEETTKEILKGENRSSSTSSSRRGGGDPRVKEILAEITRREGHKIAHYAKEAREVKLALEDYEADQILGCWEEMKKNPFWGGRWLPLATVVDHLGLFVQGRLRVGRRSNKSEAPKRYTRPEEIG